MSDETQTRLKAAYYDQTVRSLREMIASERQWVEAVARDMAETLSGDVTYPYAGPRAHEVAQRAVRLSTLHDILGMMTRNVESLPASVGGRL